MNNPTGRLAARLLPYPSSPGFKVAGPSQQAATVVAGTAKALRERALECFKAAPAGLTADEVAAELDASVLAIRPRVAELHRTAKIEDTTKRRKNHSGMSATVWRYRTEEGSP